jgi:hypothetical protein
MKPTLLLLAALLVGCKDNADSPPLNFTSETGEKITVQTIVLDGNEYYATRSYRGGWSLCLKAPPKVEKP